MRVVLGQLNLSVGDLSGNAQKVIDTLKMAEEENADLAVFPEMTITGYPAEDLLLKPGFIDDNMAALHEIAASTGRCTALVGFAMPGAVDPKLTDLVEELKQEDSEHISEQARWPGLFNAAAVLRDGAVQTQILKSHLPNYAVFDERRYFAEGVPAQPLNIAGSQVGIAICEDLWVDGIAVRNLRIAKTDIMAHLNASPYYAGKQEDRFRLITRRAREFQCPLIYVNLVGGQDELVFDGGSMIVSPGGKVIARARQFEEDVMVVDLEISQKLKPQKEKTARQMERTEEIFNALVLGTRDYVRKNGFSQVLVGISGGIDSSLVAAIATEALGPENVHGVAMPSRYSSAHSLEDAKALAANLNIHYMEIPIEQAHQALSQTLSPMTDSSNTAAQLADENIQARIRGTLLMALSNINGWLVLTTGNKSENSVGYSTLYGDTAGAFAVIKDLWKADVYKTAEFINRRHKKKLIPKNIFDKPPSAELRTDQRDDQALPPYDELDPILRSLVEEDMTPSELIAQGSDAGLVKSIAHLLDQAEYKRRQVPPGIRISSKAFGKDRRLPITNLYF